MSTAGRSRKPDTERDTDSNSNKSQSGGGNRAHSDTRAVGLTSQRTRFVPIPQSALSSNQGSRGQAKPPQPVPLTAARTNNQLKASTQPTAEYLGPAVGNAATPAAGPATQASSVWGVAGPTLAQRLGQQQQSQSRPDSASTGPASCIPPSQASGEMPSSTSAAAQATPSSWLSSMAPAAAVATHPDASQDHAQSSSSRPQPRPAQNSGDASAAGSQPQAQAGGAAERLDSGSVDKAQSQRSGRRRGSSRGANPQAGQSQQAAHHQDRPERQERQDAPSRQHPQQFGGALQQQAPAQEEQPQLQQPPLQLLPPLPNAPQLPPQQPQLLPQQQQQRRGQGQQARNRDDGAARQMPRVNLGRAAAEGAAARPPSTPAASEPPRAFSGEVDQTPIGPGTPHERFSNPSTPTPATPHASEPGGGQGNQAFAQGPFAQERPAHAAPAGSSSRSSSPPIADPSQAANSQGSAGNLNAAAPTTAAAQPESLPTQHGSSSTDTPSAPAAPASTSKDASGSLLTFGSFSLPFGPPVGFSISHPQGQSSGHLAAAPDTAKSARHLAPASADGSCLPETALDAGNVPGRFQLPSDPAKMPASGQLDAALESGPSHMSGAAAPEGVGWDSSQEASAATAAPSSGEAPSPFTQPQASTESAAASPLHARTDSAASTSSPGLSTHDSQRKRSSSQASGRGSSSSRSRLHGFQHPQQRGQTPQAYYSPQEQWALDQHQHQMAFQQQYWPGYEYPDMYPTGYSSSQGLGWSPNQGYPEPGMYDQQGSVNPYWGQHQQVGYAYDGPPDFAAHPPLPRGRGRGQSHHRHHTNANSQYAAQHYAGPQHPSQQFPSQLPHSQQQLPVQQYVSHQLPAQHHPRQQGSQHGSPQHSSVVGGRQSFPDLPRSLSQSSEQAQPSHAHGHPGQAHQPPPQYAHIAPAQQPSLPSAAYSQPPPAQPQPTPQSQHHAPTLSADCAAHAAGVRGQQTTSLQTSFAQPEGPGQQDHAAMMLQARRQHQQQLSHQHHDQHREQQPQLQQPGRQASQPGPQLQQFGSQLQQAGSELQQPGSQLQPPGSQLQHAQQQVPQHAQRQIEALSSQVQPHSRQQQQPERQQQQQLPQHQQQPPQLQKLFGQLQEKPKRQPTQSQPQPQNKAADKMLTLVDAEAQMQGKGSNTSASAHQSNAAGQSGTVSVPNHLGQDDQAPAAAQSTAPQSRDTLQQQQQTQTVPASTHAIDTAQAVSTSAGTSRGQSGTTSTAASQSGSGLAPEHPAPKGETSAAVSPSESSVQQPQAPAPKVASSWASLVKAPPTSSSQRHPSSASSQPSISRPQHAQQQNQTHTSSDGPQHQADSSSQPLAPKPYQSEVPESMQSQHADTQPSSRAETLGEAAKEVNMGSDSSATAQAIQAASLSAPLSLRAPSSLVVGAAVPSTKDAVFFSQQPDSAAPDSKAQSSTAAPAAAVAAAGKTAKGSGVSQPAKPATPQRSLDGLDEAVIKSVKALCQVETAQEGSEEGVRLQPRGLRNAGNLCFMNATLQALMGGSSFCAFVDALRAAAPALPSSDLPTLHCFSQLAKAFPAQPQSRKEPDQPQPQPKAGAEQPQDDSSAQPMVNGHEEKEDKSESKAEVETMSSDDKAESVTSEPKSDVRFDVKADAKLASKADAKVASKADVKAASKGGKASSRAASSDGGTDAKASKAVPKVPSSVKLQLELAGQPVMPDMMYKTLDIFNPHNAKLIAATAAGQELTMAQKLSRGVQKTAKHREQEDAQEFLTFLLDSTHQELLKLRAMYSTQGSSAATSYDENWEHVARKGKSNVTRGQEDVQGGRTLTSQIFGGAVQSTVKAARAKASVTVQPFNLLHLDIHKMSNITAALQMLTKPEDIHDYKATDDSVPVTAKKEIKLLRLPRILVLHMCRFTYSSQGLTKLHYKMQFSVKLRIQQSLLADDCEQRRHGGADYELIASVSHHGLTPASGHYTADVKQPDGEWLRFDDDHVSHVSVPQVLQRDTEMYLLFYEMKSRT